MKKSVLTKQAFKDFQTFRAMTCIFADFNHKTNNGALYLHQYGMQIRSFVCCLVSVVCVCDFAPGLNLGVSK